MKLVVSTYMPIFQLNLKVLLSESRMFVGSTKMDWELAIRLAIKPPSLLFLPEEIIPL